MEKQKALNKRLFIFVVLPGFEPGSSESESDMVTVTLQNYYGTANVIHTRGFANAFIAIL